jgi:O-antigen/teichoic acid export membrane protein
MSEAAGRLRSLLLSVPAAVRQDYLASVAVQWSSLALQLVLFHLVAERGSVNGFAFYQIARGAVSTVQPLAMAGLGTGLQRYLPRCGARAPTLARRAFGVQVAIMVVVAIAGYSLAGPLSELLGLDGKRAVGAITIMLAGNCLCTTSVAALRGTGQVAFANLTSLAGLAVVPVVAFFLASGIESFLVLQGAGMLGAAGCAVAATEAPPETKPTGWAGADTEAPAVFSSAATEAAADPRPGGTDSGDEASLRKLVRYGLGRTPGDLALPALFAFPTFAVANALPGAGDAGYVGFMTSAVTLVCSIFAMLSPVLLPRLSASFHNPGGGASMHRGLLVLPLAAAGTAALIGTVVALLAPVLVRWFLGAEFAGAEPVLRLGLLASVPVAMFYAIRPTLDALQDMPMTTWLLVASLAVEVPLTYVLRLVVQPPFAAVLAFVLGAVTLGVAGYLVLVRAMAARSV